MIRTDLRTGVLALALLATGCLSARSYVATALPADPKPTAADLQRGGSLVALDFTFTTNGKPNPRATEAVRKIVIEQMAALRVATVATDPAAPVRCRLRITMDNVADTAEAFRKGFKTGLTFGGSGSTVTDGYAFQAIVERDGAPPVQKSYQHAISTLIGAGEGPAGLTPLAPAEAVRAVVNDLLVVLLRDLQAEGILVSPVAPAST